MSPHSSRRATRRHPLSPQAHRLIAMRFLVYVGIQASYFIGVLGTLTYVLGSDALGNALAVAFMNACLIVGSFVGGSLLDLWGPRRHFVLAVAGMVVASVYFLTTNETAFHIILGAAILGFMIGLTDVITRSYPAYLSGDPRELKRINGAISAASNIGVVVGPLVGGAIAAVAPTNAVFVFTLVCAVVALVPGLGFRPLRSPHDDGAVARGDVPAGAGTRGAGGGATGASLAAGGETAEPASRATGIHEGIRAVTGSMALTLLFWVGFLCFLGYGAFDPIESLFYRDVLKVGASWMGWLSAAAGAGAVLGALVIMRLPGRLMNIRTLLIIQIIEGIGCLLYVGTPLVGVAMTGQLVLGCAFGAFTPLQNTLMQRHAPLAVVGRVSSIMNFGFNIAGVLPLVAAPWLAATLGVQGALLVASATVLVMPAIILVVRWKRVAALSREEAESPTSE